MIKTKVDSEKKEAGGLSSKCIELVNVVNRCRSLGLFVQQPTQLMQNTVKQVRHGLP